MSAGILAANRRQAVQLIFWQALAAVALGVLCLALWGTKSGWSALTGGGVGVVSTGYMAFALLRQGPDASAVQITIGFFVGWAIKTLLTIALLWLVLKSKAFAPLPVLAGFAASFVAYWIVGVRRRV